jgi:hypothetical protein
MTENALQNEILLLATLQSDFYYKNVLDQFQPK